MTFHCQTTKNVQNVTKDSGKLGNTRPILLLVKWIHAHLYARFVKKPFGRGEHHVPYEAETQKARGASRETLFLLHALW